MRRRRREGEVGVLGGCRWWSEGFVRCFQLEFCVEVFVGEGSEVGVDWRRRRCDVTEEDGDGQVWIGLVVKLVSLSKLVEIR